ncbi:hypothetical protein CDL15_Pgr012979 [Punica granatum]|uniref:Uncharacterized protein n=1 Tax=Punica granatum TaxID=22663 RepID=A0A218XFD1_PUNGR|nr:hypothetical protein CDL15_Pgr012979 [Punica granatum]
MPLLLPHATCLTEEEEVYNHRRGGGDHTTSPTTEQRGEVGGGTLQSPGRCQHRLCHRSESGDVRDDQGLLQFSSGRNRD